MKKNVVTKENYPASRKFDAPWGETQATKLSEDSPWIFNAPWGEVKIFGSYYEAQAKLEYYGE